jgi:hypothetical protein
MYAMIRRYGRVAGSSDDLASACRALAAVLAKAPGFISYAVLDAGDGACATVSTFERQADLDAADQLVGRWIAENLAGLLPDAPQVISGEVIAQKGI